MTVRARSGTYCPAFGMEVFDVLPPTIGKPGAPEPLRTANHETAAIRLGYAAGRTTVSQRITRAGSSYIKVHVASLRLAAGDYLTVANPAGRERYTYHASPLDRQVKGDSAYTIDGSGFWPMSVSGDTAIVTLHTARRAAALQGYGVSVDGYYRGLTSAEQRHEDLNAPESVCSSDARRDTICYKTSNPTEYTRSLAVGKLVMPGGSCTAWRVGSTNRLLTNNHCFSTQSEVAASEVWFNYACQTCGGNNPATPTKVSGATFYKTSSALDYTLFSVNNFDTIASYGYLLIDNRSAVANERIYIAGHGEGNPNKLSIYEDTQGGAVCDVDSTNLDAQSIGYYCDTAPGSSGSPVLAASSHKVIALQHWGGCLNGGVKINQVYAEISGLIDNGGTPPSTGPYFENTSDVSIPDAGAAVTSSINVTGVSGNASSGLQVGVDIKHTYRGDLVIDLVVPDGTAYRLKNSSTSDSADNVIATYTVNASSEVANGTWRLRVQDVYSVDTGYIDKFSLQF